MVYHRRPGEEGAILTLAGKYTGTRAPRARGATVPGVPPATLAPGTPRLPSPSALLLSSSSEVGGDAERGLWRCSRQLLPPRQRAGERPPRVPVPRVSPSPPGLTFSLPQVQVGVELEANTRLQDTTFAFGYQLNLPQANMVFRGERGATLAPGGPGASRPLTLSPCRAPGQ